MSEKNHRNSFLSQINSSRAEFLYRVNGKNSDNQRVWFYLLVKREKMVPFEIAVESGSMDVADYGQILECGIGDDPPSYIRDRLQEKYGFEIIA